MNPRSSRKPKSNRKSKIKTVFISIFTLIILAIGLFIGYSLDYYEADETAQNLLITTEEVELLNDSPIHFSPTEPSDIGVIFYPGGKVDETAYTPLIQPLAKAGYETFIADMPFHLAHPDNHKKVPQYETQGFRSHRYRFVLRHWRRHCPPVCRARLSRCH